MIIYPILLISRRGWMAGLTRILAQITHTSKKMDSQIKEERTRVMALNDAFIF